MDIRVNEQLWATSMAPEGVLRQWFVADGAGIDEGQAIALVCIEDGLHDIIAPATGRLCQIVVEGGLIEPGSLIGTVTHLSR